MKRWKLKDDMKTLRNIALDTNRLFDGRSLDLNSRRGGSLHNTGVSHPALIRRQGYAVPPPKEHPVVRHK
jgi:hypothetical protein